MGIGMSTSSLKSDKSKIETLALSAKSGDKFAFIELIGIFHPYTSPLARKFNLPESEFDDLCQEGRIALYRAVCNYNPTRFSFITFARTCIRNAMISHTREYSSDNKLSVNSISLDDTDTENAFVAPDESPEEILIAKELISELHSAMSATLSESEYSVLEYKMLGIGAAEISVITGKDIKSVENTLFRARKKIKAYLSAK